jgi:hypothetical protein
MDLKPIIARLKTQLTGLKAIGTSAAMLAAREGVVALPAAFVLPLGEQGADMGMLSTTGQSVNQLFGVVHVLTNLRDVQGDAALDDLHTLRMNLRAALVGWVPDASTGEAVTFTSGRMVEFDEKGRLWWTDEFQVTTYYWSA